MASLRQRNRLNAMRLTQRTALDMFIRDGFTNVTVEQIAREVGMAASTIYRHFTTKEAIVLWDEHEPALDKALEHKLKTLPPFRAIREAFIETLAELYNDAFQLKKITYIYRTSELHAAAVESDFADREDLTEALIGLLPRRQRSAAPIVTGAAMLALDVALDQWQASNGKKPLRELLQAAFDQLENLARLDAD